MVLKYSSSSSSWNFYNKKHCNVPWEKLCFYLEEQRKLQSTYAINNLLILLKTQYTQHKEFNTYYLAGEFGEKKAEENK